LFQYVSLYISKNRLHFRTYKGIRTDSKGYEKKTFRSSERDCGNCPLREACCGKVSRFKKIDESIHKPLYDRMHEKLTKNKAYHRRLVKRRSGTAEPVLGTLINHHNMKRINIRGMAQAGKHVLMAALCYNLKKYLKFNAKKVLLMAQAVQKGIGSFNKACKRSYLLQVSPCTDC
jgi:hypothetical protein